MHIATGVGTRNTRRNTMQNTTPYNTRRSTMIGKLEPRQVRQDFSRIPHHILSHITHGASYASHLISHDDVVSSVSPRALVELVCV